MTDTIRLNLRLSFPGGIPLSHGKAELMELIRETGSIRQAAAKMDMSYRRAWLLVDELNHLFLEPSLETKQGGKSGGGAALTAFGEELLKRFRAMEKRTMKVLADDLDWLAAHRADQVAAPDEEPGAR
jgi:molybdate transport system regulatory protein